MPFLPKIAEHNPKIIYAEEKIQQWNMLQIDWLVGHLNNGLPRTKYLFWQPNLST
jgi:hypothetical protein